jgi:lauroyl/myristoyl acyltransferase
VSLSAGIKHFLAVPIFRTLRGLERLLSPDHLYSLLFPLALTWALAHKNDAPPGCPALGQSSPVRRLHAVRIKYILSRILEFFPDRLLAPKWQCRFATGGLQHLQQARKNGHPVVLVCFHFGAYKLTPFWLRALGIPVIGLLRGNSRERSRLKKMKDKLSPFPRMPTVLYSEDQLRSAVEHLSKGTVLLLTVDRAVGKQVIVPIDEEWSFQMATGSIRLASHCHAELMPCFMIDEGRWNFRLQIGQPIPPDYLTKESDVAQTAEYLLQEMLPYVREHPEEAGAHLRGRFQRASPRRILETPLV